MIVAIRPREKLFHPVYVHASIARAPPGAASTLF